MAAGRYTSRVFVVGSALLADLQALTIPAFQTRVPPVRFGDTDPDKGNEIIGVIVSPDPPQAEWARMSPAGRDETLVFDVVHRMLNPNVKTPADVWARMAAVADLIQSVTYNTVTERLVALGFNGEVHAGKVVSVTPQVGPIEGGWGGVCTIRFEFLASI